MRFRAVFPAKSIANAALVYRTDEYSFDVEPSRANFTSVLFNDLNIEIDCAGRAVSVWGLCPYTTWTAARVSPPEASFGDLFFISDKPLVGGVSLRVDSQRWPVFVDRDSGWILLDRGRTPDIAVKLLSGIIMGIGEDGELAGIWLKPMILPTQLTV